MEVVLDLGCTNESDAILMQRIANRDTVALEVLYDHYAQAIFNILIRMVKNPGVTEDLIQETFWQVWCKAEQYKGTGTVAGWLFRVARNKALDYLRQQKAHGWREMLDWNTIQESAHQHVNVSLHRDTTEEQVEGRQISHLLHHALKQISAEQRLCIEMAYFEEMSHSEIAAHVNLPLGTIKTRIQSGIQKLRRSLQARSVYWSA